MASPAKKQKTGNQLEALKQVTSVVADTGDFNTMKEFSPEDATTNPSLIFKAADLPEYSHLMDDAITFGKGDLDLVMDKLAVNFGLEILKIVPGYVSTEVDARLSFDTKASVARAKRIIEMYEAAGVDKSRVLIKLATTWECLRAASVLKKEGINCNMTLLFSFTQAVAAAEAGVKLISPFVGRILDWHKKAQNVDGFAPHADPGVLSVSDIFYYYKKNKYKTIVMGASFRNKGEICELAGCDKLTIAPSLLGELRECSDALPLKLNAAAIPESTPVKPKKKMNEAAFRWGLNEDAMATEKLAEGIRNFAADLVKLETVVKAKMAKA